MTKLLIILLLIFITFFYCFQSCLNPKIINNKNYIFYDIHDKDYKKIIFNTNNKFTILPFKSEKKWIIHSKINNNLTGEVNFNVKGKLNPPPVNLLLKFQKINNTNKIIILLFDPTGQISPINQPVNIWYNIKH